MSLEITTYLVLHQIWQNITLLLVVTSTILLVLTEMLSAKYGKINIRADRAKLRSLSVLIAFLALASLALLIIT